MAAANYLYLPPAQALRWFKILAVFRCAASQGKEPGFELPPGHQPLRVDPVDGRFSILVIDDQELLREALGEYLRLQGYEVALAESGAAAMALMEHGLLPDLLLCDVVLPDIHGPSFVREARLLAPDVKVLFVSGYPEQPSVRAVPGAEFLQKPFRLDLLARRLRNLLVSSPAPQ